MMKKAFAVLAACLMLLLPALSPAEEPAASYDPLPIDFSFGHVTPDENYTESSYEDPTLSVQLEKIVTETGTWNVARVRIADPSQLRTVVTARGRTNRISTMARAVHAVIAIGGEYFTSDEGGFIMRMGSVQQGRRTPYETRDLLAIDEHGDFHILVRRRDAKVNGRAQSINPDFPSQLRALTEAHTLINVFDFGPALIIDGEVQPMPDTYSFNLGRREPRCAIGQTGPLEYVLVVVDAARDGRSGATYDELAAFMAEQGCLQAYNLDGGNSALMVFHGENYSDKSYEAERAVSDIIYFATLVDYGLDGD